MRLLAVCGDAGPTPRRGRASKHVYQCVSASAGHRAHRALVRCGVALVRTAYERPRLTASRALLRLSEGERESEVRKGVFCAIVVIVTRSKP